MIRGVLRRAAAAVLSAVAAASPAAGAQTVEPLRGSTALLDVPYVPQTEALCGGAAAAMVMRYWGATDVDASDFAPLLDRAAHGIRTDALVAALRQRSWAAVAGPGSPDDVHRQLARGRPVIALVASGPDRFHYVVVVSWIGGKVVLHDPARAPFRVLRDVRFDAAWAKSNFWMLVLLPPHTLPSAAPAEAPAPSGTGDEGGACADQLRTAIQSAQAGDHASARSTLDAASGRCPASAAVWRELAGEDAVDSNWPSAADHARRALGLDPYDGQAWRILATAEYLERRDRPALDAWNHVGEPRLDLITITGLRRTRYGIAADAVDMQRGMPVTSGDLDRAERRLRDVPSIARATVSYKPVEHGRAQVEATVVERDPAPTSLPAWIGMGLEAAIDREVTAGFASPTGGGEVVSGVWRWWHNRPMVSGSFAAPAPRVVGGTWRVDASDETQTFGSTSLKETRTHAGVLGDRWMASNVKIGAGLSIEDWRNGPRMMAISTRAEAHESEDRLIVAAGASWFVGNAAAFQTADLSLRWRSSTAQQGRVWLADSGAQIATHAAPASVWPGAGTGRARPALLRAHPLLSDGVITGSTFGRRLAFANGEAQQWLHPRRWPIGVAPAVFVDVARASRGFRWNDSRTQVDGGAGVRIALPGAGELRVDVAHGLRDGRSALSAGWTRNW